MHWFVKHLMLYSQLFSAISALSFMKCKNSVTTASGSVAPKGPYYPGQLIFEDHFNTFNLDVWKHEISLGGGGVRDCVLVIKFLKFTKSTCRIGNFNFTTTIDQIHMWKKVSFI